MSNIDPMKLDVDIEQFWKDDELALQNTVSARMHRRWRWASG